MGEEFYAAIKLVTGEEIFALVCIDENDGDPVIILQNPVIMKMFNNNIGSFLKIKPWMELPEDDFFIIKMDKIVTITEIKTQSLIYLYNNYISDSPDSNEDKDLMEEEPGKVKISNKMGFISTVEDARKYLEKIFDNDLKDNKES